MNKRITIVIDVKSVTDNDTLLKAAEREAEVILARFDSDEIDDGLVWSVTVHDIKEYVEE